MYTMQRSGSFTVIVAAIAVAAGWCPGVGRRRQRGRSGDVRHRRPGLGSHRRGALPSSADATRIVRELWTQREDAVGRLDAEGFGVMETGAAQAILILRQRGIRRTAGANAGGGPGRDPCKAASPRSPHGRRRRVVHGGGCRRSTCTTENGPGRRLASPGTAVVEDRVHHARLVQGAAAADAAEASTGLHGAVDGRHPGADPPAGGDRREDCVPAGTHRKPATAPTSIRPWPSGRARAPCPDRSAQRPCARAPHGA